MPASPAPPLLTPVSTHVEVVAPGTHVEVVAEVAHGRTWVKDDRLLKGHEINGPVPHREWFVLDSMGERIGRVNTDKARCMSRLDFFLLMFPPEHLTRIIAMTNEQLRSKERKEITKGELLKFFGVIILGTRLEFGSRSDLWATTSLSSFIDAPKFGEKTGMSRARFDQIWSSIRFSHQPRQRPDHRGYEE